jgi:hypothetical protein
MEFIHNIEPYNALGLGLMIGWVISTLYYVCIETKETEEIEVVNAEVVKPCKCGGSTGEHYTRYTKYNHPNH